MRRLIAEEPVSRASIWSRRCALFALALAGIAVATIRLAAIEVTAGLAILGAAFLFAFVAMLLAAAAIVIIWRTGRRGSRIALSGFFLAAALLAYPGWLAAKAVRLPVLADVTTDTADPPTFARSAKAQAARGGIMPAEPPPGTRDAQRRAYPDIRPILLDLSPEDAYQAVQQAIAALGWKIVEQSPPGGRAGLGHVDAMSRTLILGLPDDIAIRITPLASQTRIDVRWVSRYGRHDFGEGAARIRAFGEALQAEIEE